MRKKNTTGSTQGYRDLGALTASILSNLPEGIVIDDRRFVRVGEDSDKRVGMTVGKIVRMFDSEEDRKISAEEFDLDKDGESRVVDEDVSPMYLLVKKSNRYQELEEGSRGIIQKDLSRDMTLDGFKRRYKS